MTTATISYNDGKVYLECDGNPVVITIDYEGVVEATSMLPNGFIIQEKNNRIIIIRLVADQFPELLFEYKGSFKIKKTDLYNNTIRITALSKTKTHQFYRIQDNWNQLNSSWSEYYDDYYFGQIRTRKTNIVTKGLSSTSGGLALKDGTAYYGDVHLHSNGIFMTGGEHNEDSEMLYKKRRKRLIKKGITREI